MEYITNCFVIERTIIVFLNVIFNTFCFGIILTLNTHCLSLLNSKKKKGKRFIQNVLCMIIDVDSSI